MPRPIIVAASIAAVLVLGACGSTDASEDDVHDVLTEAGANDEQADCAAGEIADELTQSELNDLAGADTPEDIPDDIQEKIDPILERCLAEGGPVEEDESEGEGDTSTTTVAEEGATTTTTAAPAGPTTTAAPAGPTTTAAG
ncbi:MAG TPA: hypothetical protein VIL36_06445 [Acidimicrobiales bacterium]